MSDRIPRLEFEQLEPALAAALEPRVKRLGYLGEFFKCAAHQPAALLDFVNFTEHAKQGLAKNLVEVIALTVASRLGNAYERNQHERLSVRLGLGREWVAEVERLAPDAAAIGEAESAVQRFVLLCLDGHGRGAGDGLDALIDTVGHAQAVAVLMVIGRYMTHALFVNALGLAPPVPSIFEDGFTG